MLNDKIITENINVNSKLSTKNSQNKITPTFCDEYGTFGSSCLVSGPECGHVMKVKRYKLQHSYFSTSAVPQLATRTGTIIVMIWYQHLMKKDSRSTRIK